MELELSVCDSWMSPNWVTLLKHSVALDSRGCVWMVKVLRDVLFITVNCWIYRHEIILLCYELVASYCFA